MATEHIQPGDHPRFGVAEVFEDRTPGTTYCPECHRPMLSHRWLGASLLCPEHALWDADLPRWEPA